MCLCFICYTPLCLKESCVLSCGHSLHKECFSRSCQASGNQCPYCRSQDATVQTLFTQPHDQCRTEDVTISHTGCIKHIEILQKQLEEKRKELIEKEKEILNLKGEVENALIDMIRYECGAVEAETDYIIQIDGMKKIHEAQMANEKQKLNDEKLKNQFDLMQLKNEVDQVFRKHNK